MDFRMREALRKSRIFLLDNVIFDILIDHLIDQDIFSDSMLDYIKAGTDRVEKIRRLMDYLIRRPNSCYRKFLIALTNSGQEHCATNIQQNYVQSGPTQVSEPMPTTIPPVEPASYGIPVEDDPMENHSSAPKNSFSCLPQEDVRLGFPEVSASMNAYPGSFTTFPVQESSAGGGEFTPSCSSFVQSMGEVNGTENLNISSPTENNMAFSHQANPQQNLSVYQQHMLSNPSGVYRMESTPRGLALIINNENFKKMSRRMGSKRDMENLYFLFKHLGFHICHMMDKTAQEMRELLKSFAQYESLQQADALVVVILSHGGRNGIIYGTEGSHGKGRAHDYITDEEIRDMFSSRNCPLMANKPKLIIIQACRGVNEDVSDGSDGVRQWSPTAAPIPCSNGLGQDGGSNVSSVSTASSARIANLADMCLIHSTVQGYVSYRHPVDGSPFIQEMASVFHEMADREHLNDMMTQVNNRLASRRLDEDLRTVPSTTNTLTKKWFLNPPLSKQPSTNPQSFDRH